uniref:Ribonuclease H-like domain, reverse transcriptase, RNA-dependent DNA polymerase n=1 Tax=Tanacetum cinerariifolium TaxID=118510 RepID=A0A6L2M2D8_TANCI|nr:ribonuclease H-like domain, reverse transcriptase, RNA-dependent DNA polymerase [Tanacetum cinerariifolium]
MANLEFVDQHNMVACLEKTEGNSNFHEIVDFLTSSLIHHALNVSPAIYTSYIEQFWNTASSQTVNDEKRPTPVIESLSSHNTTQDSRDSLKGTNGSEGDQVQTPHDSPPSGGHTSNRVKGEAAEIIALKTRIKKLEKKCKPSISHHRAWLKSVQRLSMKKRFGKKESLSKRGRKKAKPESALDDSTVFDDLNADHGLEYMDTEEVVDEGRQSNETEELKLTTDTEKITEDKGSGEKGGITDELVSTDVPETVSTARPDVDTARQEVSAVEPRTPPTTTNPKDKGKGVLKESPVKKVKRSDLDAAQIAKDAESSKTTEMYDEVQAADALFAAKLQQKEREEYAIKERAKFLAETLAAQRKFKAAQRSAEIRSRPPTKSQLRNLIITYLKNIDDTVKDIKEAAGVHKEKVLEEPNSTKVEVKQEGHKENIKKRPRRKLKMKATKKSKRPNADLEEEEQLRVFLKIILDEEEIIDYEVLDKRLDLEELYNLVMQRFETTTPEGVNLVLWGDLRIMFEETADDDL